MHPATIAQVMVNFAARFGVDGQACLLGTGVELDDLQRPDTWLQRSQEMRLLENMIMSLPDIPALGFELGLQYNVSTFGIWGFAIRTSPTLASGRSNTWQNSSSSRRNTIGWEPATLSPGLKTRCDWPK